MTDSRVSVRLRFLRQFLRNPRELGSVMPSSRFLTSALLSEIDFAHARRVVELGPGTGVFTRQVLRRLAPEGALLLLETNPDFVAMLRRDLSDPRVTIANVSAEQVRDEVAALGWKGADAVISGIPYALLPRHTTSAIVRASCKALSPHGRFVGYQYSPYLRPFLLSTFGNARYRLVPLNVPPAFVYVSHKQGS